MKTLTKLFLIFCLFPACLFSQETTFQLEKATTFHPGDEEINKENIEWNYFYVPENWDKPNGKTIKIAVAIIKSLSKNTAKNAVIYIEGGPGAGSIERIWSWLDHPLRKNNDMILVDVRGTGFSLPKFCPELGNKFLEILAKNQKAGEDERQKVMAALSCKDELISKGIDINSYNSKSIAKDLNALKKALKYTTWNIYGISYGTYEAQVYANDFPEDVKSLILDSSISDISEYYSHNTDNYMSSLKKVFSACKNDAECNKKYPNLEEKYFSTIEKLDKAPITVNVDKKILASGKFTYNAEDFKVAIQQSLYQQDLIAVVPLLITEFHAGNKNTLSTLVSAFSAGLTFDYGAYYCITCNEVIPFNSITAFDANSSKYKGLKGGLSFYRSDFSVCNKWLSEKDKSEKALHLNQLENLSQLTAPVLVFSGEFDPITPPSNGAFLINKFKKNGFLVNAPISGHAPSFSKIGFKILSEFLGHPDKTPNANGFTSNNKVKFISDVVLNSGVSNFANSLGEMNIVFLLPIIVAFIMLLVLLVRFIYLFFKIKEDTTQSKAMKLLIALSSLLGLLIIVLLVLAIMDTANDNFYILAFGLQDKFSYLFLFQWVFVVLTAISILYFIIRFSRISSKGAVSISLSALILICMYFQYWGFLL
ncbi:alpha/beta fold hydrolase [Flavobacterium sp.]|uniref:alpha/beta fold hydrolase n=1 Tax=Flavobacterium sp. TaxID=239 RepID=UPI003D6AF278